MATYYAEADIICPFYRTILKTGISCEGPEEKSWYIVRYDTKDRMEKHMDEYCKCDRWQQCDIAKILEKKHVD